MDEEVAGGQLGLVQVASLDQQALDLLPLGVDGKLWGHHLGNGLLHWLIHGHGGCGNTSCWWASGKLWTQQGLQIQKHNFHGNNCMAVECAHVHDFGMHHGSNAEHFVLDLLLHI